MIRILFVCHGNICRSPMAEFMLKDMVRKAGFEKHFRIDSAATSTEELGNPVYPPVRKILSANGISCDGKTARQLSRLDYECYDLIIGMDHANIRNIVRICGGDPAEKVRLLLDYTPHPGEVADPWYSGDFEATRREIQAGCEGLLANLAETLLPRKISPRKTAAKPPADGS